MQETIKECISCMNPINIMLYDEDKKVNIFKGDFASENFASTGIWTQTQSFLIIAKPFVEA